ncbi:hypothetical protein [Microbacterium aurantiacum]|uniref:hypothetical protein n=1 Tax=Microbacterium aurantiacum TaxID=162393 RepID=UPI00336EDD70
MRRVEVCSDLLSSLGWVYAQNAPGIAVVLSAFDECSEHSHERERSDAGGPSSPRPLRGLIDECFADIEDDSPDVGQMMEFTHPAILPGPRE